TPLKNTRKTAPSRSRLGSGLAVFHQLWWPAGPWGTPSRSWLGSCALDRRHPTEPCASGYNGLLQQGKVWGLDRF
ncbi:MAG: hypothetical protein WAM39_27200, partial [Bryobacteraceae bacterium]